MKKNEKVQLEHKVKLIEDDNDKLRRILERKEKELEAKEIRFEELRPWLLKFGKNDERLMNIISRASKEQKKKNVAGLLSEVETLRA